jgi:hypothetical protein
MGDGLSSLWSCCWWAAVAFIARASSLPSGTCLDRSADRGVDAHGLTNLQRVGRVLMISVIVVVA